MAQGKKELIPCEFRMLHDTRATGETDDGHGNIDPLRGGTIRDGKKGHSATEAEKGGGEKEKKGSTTKSEKVTSIYVFSCDE